MVYGCAWAQVGANVGVSAVCVDVLGVLPVPVRVPAGILGVTACVGVIVCILGVPVCGCTGCIRGCTRCTCGYTCGCT